MPGSFLLRAQRRLDCLCFNPQPLIFTMSEEQDPMFDFSKQPPDRRQEVLERIERHLHSLVILIGIPVYSEKVINGDILSPEFYQLAKMYNLPAYAKTKPELPKG